MSRRNASFQLQCKHLHGSVYSNFLQTFPMKKPLIILTPLLLSTLSLTARTWTSSDGTRTFEGDFKSYNSSTQTVTVIKNSKNLQVPISALSAEDQQWIRDNASKPSEAVLSIEDQLADQKVGAHLNSKTLSRFDGAKFVKADLEKAPDYYLLYFTASW